MTYLILDGVMLAIVAVVSVIALRRRTKLVPPILVTLVVLLALTAVFDNVMIAAGLFTYADADRTGITVGLAPIEDFAYPIAAAFLLPSLWILLGGGKREGAVS